MSEDASGMGPGSPCSVGCQMCLDFFLPLLKPCLSAAGLFRLGVFTGVPVGWMGGLYRSVPGWRGAQQRRVHLHPGQDPVAGVMSPSLSFQTLFPCQCLELWDSRHSTGSSTPGTTGLSPLALYNQWPCAAPSRRLLIGGHTEWAGGERTPPPPRDALKRLWQWWLHTDHLRHEQRGRPGPSGGARRAVFPQVSQGEGPEGSSGTAGRRPGGPGA